MKTAGTRILAAAAMVVIAGCTVGPDYVKPKVDTPQTFKESSQANGVWIVTSIAYRLESEKLNGAWFASVRGNKTGLAVTH